MKTKKTNGHEAIKVEKGIPLPPIGLKAGLTAALDSMEVGDSFRIAKGSYGSVRTMAGMRNFSIRTRADGEGYIRVWRVA